MIPIVITVNTADYIVGETREKVDTSSKIPDIPCFSSFIYYAVII
jgi:flagellar biogenesis protein FliO